MRALLPTSTRPSASTRGMPRRGSNAASPGAEQAIAVAAMLTSPPPDGLIRNSPARWRSCSTKNDFPPESQIRYGNSATCSSPVRLGEAEHQVHILHRLARRPLGEIVERRADDGAARNAVGGDPDEGHVGAAHVAGLRQARRTAARERTAPSRKTLKVSHEDPAARP